MQYNITLIKQFNRLLFFCILYFLIFASVLLVYDKEITAPYCMLGIPLLLLYYAVIERYVYHLFLYMLLHGLAFVPVFLLPFPTVLYRYLYLMLLVSEISHAGYIWRHNQDKAYDGAPWPVFLFLVLFSFIFKAYHYDLVVDIIFYCSIAMLILHFIRFYIEGIHLTLVKSQNATSMPTRKMIFSGSLMISFLLVIFLLSAFMVKGTHADEYFIAIGKFMGKVLLALIQGILYAGTLIRAYFAKNRKTDNLEQQKQSYEDMLNSLYGDVSDPSLFSKILSFLLAAATYLFLIYCVYKIFRQLFFLYSKRYAKDSDILTTLEKKREIIRTPKEETNFIQKIRERFFFDNRFKLRQIYRAKISGHKEYFHKKQNTPRDISMEIRKIYNEDITELTALYEKARYSSEEITEDDILRSNLYSHSSSSSKR